MLSLTGARVDAQTIKLVTARRIQSIERVDTYNSYCAICHGPQAKGNGPAATALKKVPPDLTTIAKRNGGPVSGIWKDVVVVPTWKQVEMDVPTTQPGLSLFHCYQQFHMDVGFMAMMRYAE